MSLEEAIRDSDESFRKQFNPEDPTFHGGVQEVVPIGGTKVPKGLEKEADWQSLPVQEGSAEKVSFGPEYDQVEKTRNDLGDLKKALTNVTAPVDALVTLRAKLATSTGEQEKEKVQKLIDSENNKLKQALDTLETFKALFPKDSEFGSKQDNIDEVSKLSAGQFTTKEEQFDFGALIKKHTSQIFREQKTLLERMKKLKKTTK